MLKSLTPLQTTWAVFAITLAVISGAWIFEYAGYPPCELCLGQRWAYYAVVPLSALLALAANQNTKLLRYGLIVLGLIMLASCIFGIFHAGVEWKFWKGPTACTGGALKTLLPDLSKPEAMCDEPSLRIFGISLAGYNALISGFVCWLSFSKTRA